MTLSPALVVEGLTKSYRGGRVRALNGVSLEVQPGEVMGIIGPNGAGKTTLIGCLLGLLRPDTGSIRFAEGPPDSLLVRAVTGYLPERLDFERWMSGWDFVAYHHALALRPARSRREEVTSALERVRISQDAWTAPIRGYSRGMLQRLGLAQALLGTPRYLLLDEPTSGVDPTGVLQIREVLLALKGAGTTIILNSHQLDQVEKVCDRVALVGKGRVESIEDLRHHESGVQALLIRWVFAPTELEARVQQAARDAQGTVSELQGNQARFSVPGERDIATLVQALVGAGFGVVGVTAAENRLEKHFAPPREGPAL